MWTKGKAKLRYRANPSEFAGGREMGEAVSIGTFTLTKDGKDSHLSVYNGAEKQDVIATFQRTGDFD